MAATAQPTLRHHLVPDDARAIAEIHRRVYSPEYGLGDAFVAEVETNVRAAARRGWPEAGAIWLAELEDVPRGSLALTFEGENADGVYVGTVRWFALEMEIRGEGLGRRMFAELIDTAEDQGVEQLELTTFSELEAAAHLYRSFGFSLAWEREHHGWRDDGSPVLLQHYVAQL